MKITLEISDKAYKKMRAIATLKALTGKDGIGDFLLMKIVDTVESGMTECIILSREDKLHEDD